MDSLLRQLRAIGFPGFEQESQEDPYYTKEGRIPAQKTVSFKGDRKKGQNGFQRQSSGEMGELYDASDGEFATAIAAAAFAITSLEEESSVSQKRSDEGLRKSPTNTKSKREENTDKPTDLSKISRWFSGTEAKRDGRPAGETSIRKSATLDQRILEDSAADRKVSGKAMGTTPTVKKTPTFSDKYLNDTGSKRFENGQGLKPIASFGNRKWEEVDSTYKVETKADAWEIAKMAKIKKRYERMISTISGWENEKKMKAKRRMERKEREIEQMRATDLREYRNEMSRIDKISGGARALADERRRDDEQKTIKKAKVFRSTGKAPRDCFCC